MNLSHKLKKEEKKNKFQFTFFSETFKPVACIIETNKNFVEVVKDESTFRDLAIVRICQKEVGHIRSLGTLDIIGNLSIGE